MGERCGTEPTVEELKAGYERARDERIETLYQGWCARDMAERIVDLEDELGGVTEEGLCTGMHADVAEAHCEIERLTEIVKDYEHRINWFTTCGQCARLMDAVYDETIRADRYGLAWLSARRRAANEANLGAEAAEHIAADRDRWQRGHERAEAQLVPTRRRLEEAEARLAAVRAYALERCTEPHANEASASWVLHLLGDD